MSALVEWGVAIPCLLQEINECALRAYVPWEITCPPENLVVRALELVLPKDVRVVILGQDPYSTPGKASGLAFGYNRNYTGGVDSSMKNIIRELGMQGVLEQYPATRRSDWLTLESWASHGVLLLNTRLTCPQGVPLGHSHIGWDRPVRRILDHVAEIGDGRVVWLNLGVQAQLACPIPHGHPSRIDVSHPSSYSADRTESPFLGSGCFERTNKYLTSCSVEPINWTIGGTE